MNKRRIEWNEIGIASSHGWGRWWANDWSENIRVIIVVLSPKNPRTISVEAQFRRKWKWHYQSFGIYHHRHIHAPPTSHQSLFVWQTIYYWIFLFQNFDNSGWRMDASNICVRWYDDVFDSVEQWTTPRLGKMRNNWFRLRRKISEVINSFSIQSFSVAAWCRMFKHNSLVRWPNINGRCNGIVSVCCLNTIKSSTNRTTSVFWYSNQRNYFEIVKFNFNFQVEKSQTAIPSNSQDYFSSQHRSLSVNFQQRRHGRYYEIANNLQSICRFHSNWFVAMKLSVAGTMDTVVYCRNTIEMRIGIAKRKLCYCRT